MRTLLTILTVLLFSTTALGNNEPFAPAPDEPVVNTDDIERHWHFAFEEEFWTSNFTYFTETYYTNPDSDHHVQSACIVSLPPMAGGVPVSLIYIDTERNLFMYNYHEGEWVVDVDKWEPEAIEKWYMGFNRALGFESCMTNMHRF